MCQRVIQAAVFSSTATEGQASALDDLPPEMQMNRCIRPRRSEKAGLIPGIQLN